MDKDQLKITLDESIVQQKNMEELLLAVRKQSTRTDQITSEAINAVMAECNRVRELFLGKIHNYDEKSQTVIRKIHSVRVGTYNSCLELKKILGLQQGPHPTLAIVYQNANKQDIVSVLESPSNDETVEPVATIPEYQSIRRPGKPLGTRKPDARRIALKIRWNEEEFAIVQAAAQAASEDISTYIRRMVLGRAKI